MKVIDPGHRYLLDNLESPTKTEIVFMKDAKLHDGDGYSGPTCQEYLRAIIDRVETLHAERPWAGNADILYDLRHAIAGFEARAVLRHVEKDGLRIERLPLDRDGHIRLPDEA